MTNEQAAEILEEVKIIDDGLGQYIPGFDEALDLAISNLRSDCMTVEESVDALGEEPLVYFDDGYCFGKRDQWREDVAALQLTATDICIKLEGEEVVCYL